MNLYVGNLSYSSSEESVKNLFSTYGEVVSVKLITDRETGRPRGFGFVDMPDDGHAKAAIAALHDTEFEGRKLNVREAMPKGSRPPRRDDR